MGLSRRSILAAIAASPLAVLFGRGEVSSELAPMPSDLNWADVAKMRRVMKYEREQAFLKQGPTASEPAAITVEPLGTRGALIVTYEPGTEPWERDLAIERFRAEQKSDQHTIFLMPPTSRPLGMSMSPVQTPMMVTEHTAIMGTYADPPGPEPLGRRRFYDEHGSGYCYPDSDILDYSTWEAYPWVVDRHAPVTTY